MRALLILLTALSLSALVPAAARAEIPLTPERYAALDGVYSAFVTLERDVPTASDFDDARLACRALDSADPLLGAYRKACTSNVKYVRSAEEFADCVGRTICIRSARRTHMEIAELITHVRAANSAVKAATLVPACAEVLRASKAELRVMQLARDFFRLAERVVRTGSPTLGRSLLRQATTLDRLAAKEPSAARQRKSFRAVCASAPA